MDIRGPRLRKPSDRALAFTSSMESDSRIAHHIIEVNLAHMSALAKSGEVSPTVAAKCVGFLLHATPEVSLGSKAEDYHQQLEQDAVDALGVETAGFLNYGKSRNDQVATAVRMELRLRILNLLSGLTSLQSVLLAKARKEGTILVPGYTHLQRAQPVTLSHYMFAYFDSFQRDAERLLQLYSRVNLSPMGSAALAGTSAKIDRRLVASLLGFAGPSHNSMDAVSSRDIVVEAISSAAMIMLNASRLAEEQILWSSEEFGFIELSDAFAASSSIMPQKKNPVADEIVRAKAGSVLGNLVAVCAILKALPYSYNLDLQETTPHLWRALDDASESLWVLAGSLSKTKFRKDAILRSIAEDGSTAVALANHLVKTRGMSFRQAHSVVGQLVRDSEKNGTPLTLAASSSSFAKKFSIDQATAKKVLDPENFLASIATEGGSNPRFIGKEISARENELKRNKSDGADLAAQLKASERKLHRTATGLARGVKQGS